MAQQPLEDWFRANLRWWRKARNMTQADLAERLGISRPSVTQLETGDWIPGLEVVARVAEALNIKPLQLLSEPVEENSPASA